MTKITEIAIESNAARELKATVAANGDLELVGREAFESQDLGDQESRYAGDLRYVLAVPAEFKDSVLLHLIADRFETETEFVAWLREKGIPGSIRN